MKKLNILLLAIVCILLFSCDKKPYACFTYSSATDTIFVNQDVFFDAEYCSRNVDQVGWEFSDGWWYKNNLEIIHVFTSPGTHIVELKVWNTKMAYDEEWTTVTVYP